jgi:hypothetical protein
MILTTAAAACCLALAPAAVADAAPAAAGSTVSQNWSGYEVTNASGGYSAVSGGWVQPAARCTAGTPAYSAFWVGLGGGSRSSSALEQTGTQANCTAEGQAQYYAWYELVPAAPVHLNLAIHPGDRMYARVAVNGTTVHFTLENQTTGASVQRTLQMTSPSPDTSTAEWVAEAPSACTTTMQNCTPLPLSDFGTVRFTNAYATSGGHTGTIGDPAWSAQAISLAPSSGNLYTGYGYGGYGPQAVGANSSSQAGAQPSSLSSDGSAFSVGYQASDPYGYSGYGYGGYVYVWPAFG